MVGIQWPDSVSSQATKAAASSPRPETDGLGTSAMRAGLSGRGTQHGNGVGTYPNSIRSPPVSEAMPLMKAAEGRSDVSGGVAPQPGRQAVDAVLRRPEGEGATSGGGPWTDYVIHQGKTPSEVSLPRSGAGEARARLATVVEASPPPTAEHVPDGSATTAPELLDTQRSPAPSTYSDTRDSQSRSPMRRSRDGDGDTRSNASRRRERVRLPDFMVQMPAGSGNSELNGSSTFLDVEKGSFTMESQGVVRPTPNCRRCLDFEAKIKALRSEHAEDMVRERNERQQQVQVLEEKLRRTVAQAAEDEARLKKEIETLHAGSGALAAAESSLAQLRTELKSEAAVAETAARYRQEASESKAELAEAEKLRDQAKKRFEAAKRQAAESERQRRDLAKQSGTQEAQRLRGELEIASKERTELTNKLKKMVPHVQALQAEDSRLQQLLAEQTELAAMQGRTAKMESQEVAKIRDNALRQKRSLQGQVTTLTTELDEAKAKVKEAQGELTKEQRQRLDETRKQQNAKAEIKRLRAELEHTETALQQQAQAAEMRPALFVPESPPRGARNGSTPVLANGVGSQRAGQGRMVARVLAGGNTQQAAATDADTVEGAATSVGNHGSDDGSINATMVNAANTFGLANSASARLFEVIEKAKERADQRRLLSGAAEEVKIKAQALEELLANDDVSGMAC